MNSSEFERQLHTEGFRTVYAWEDAPHAFYPNHQHPMDTAHIILDGEMTITCGRSTNTYKVGERPPDVPAGAVHSARMGPMAVATSSEKSKLPSLVGEDGPAVRGSGRPSIGEEIPRRHAAAFFVMPGLVTSRPANMARILLEAPL